MNNATEALRALGGHADASALCSKMTCPHCGYGMNDAEAQLLIQRTCEAGEIVIQDDWSLKLLETTDAQ